MTEVPSPAPDPAQQPVVAMQLLDGPPAPPVERLGRSGPWAWAATMLAAAGILEILGSVERLITETIGGEDVANSGIESDVGAFSSQVRNGVQGVVQTQSTHLGVAMVAAGVLATAAALLLTGQRRWSMDRVLRPLATLAAGLVLGTLAMLTVLLWSMLTGNDQTVNLHITNTLDAGVWLCLAAFLAAIVAVVLVLRVKDAPAPEPPEVDLDTPPLGIPALSPGYQGDHEA